MCLPRICGNNFEAHEGLTEHLQSHSVFSGPQKPCVIISCRILHPRGTKPLWITIVYQYFLCFCPLIVWRNWFCANTFPQYVIFFLATKLQNFPFQPVLFSPSWHKPWGNTREVRNTYSARDIHHAEAIFITSYSHATSLLPLQSCQDTSTARNSVASPQRTSLWENVLLWIFTTAFLWNDEYTWCLRTLLHLISTV